MKFLVFEGFTRRREMIKRLISDCVRGAVIYDCGSMEEAYSVLAENSIDIFVVNLHLDKNKGEIQGLRFIELIRDSERYFDAYIIVLSELIDKQLVVYKDYHCYKFYENPIDKDEFKADIAELAFRRELCRLREKLKNTDYCFVAIEDSIYKLNISNIILIETHSKYDLIYLRDVGELTLPKSVLKGLIHNLERTGMLYCNRYDIVNMCNVAHIDRKKHMLTMDECGREIYISETGRKNLKKYLEYWKAKS